MKLDFSAIRDIPKSPRSNNNSTLKAVPVNISTEALKLDMSALRSYDGAAEQAPLLAVNKKREKEKINRAKEIYAEYQKNIVASELLRSEILKGLQHGESTEELFLKACKVISLMIGDKTFFEQVESDLLAIYGEGLKLEQPLDIKLSMIKQRIESMQKSLNADIDFNDKKRIEKALELHKKDFSRIENLIA